RHGVHGHQAFPALGRVPPSLHRKTLMIGLSATTEKRYHSRQFCSWAIPLQSDLAREKEAIMRERFSGSMTALALAGAALSVIISVSVTRTSAQAPVASGRMPTPAAALTTPW